CVPSRARRPRSADRACVTPRLAVDGPHANGDRPGHHRERRGDVKFMCLAYEEEAQLNALSPDEWDALRRETVDYVESLRASGHLVLTHALQSARTAATVRVRKDQRQVTDGPFAEAKEVVGGFFLIEARDREEAVALASRWPSARLGAI